MECIEFDSGVRSFQIKDGGVLRFNPGDPNVYGRFLEAADKIRGLEKELTGQAKEAQETENGSAMVRLLVDADRKIKEILGWVFGAGNDFDRILAGVNLLATAENGRQVITNLLAALEPVLVAGAKKYADDMTRQAVQSAQARRASQ